MRFLKSFPILSFFLALLLFGCNEVKPKGEKALRNFVKQWNADHTTIQSLYLKNDYMDMVNYYGVDISKNRVQEHKTLLFQQFPDYTQRILNEEINIVKEGARYLVSFTKQVRYNGVEADYPSYLSVVIKNGAFKIVREGVITTSQALDAPIFPESRGRDAAISYERQIFGDFNGDGLSDYASVVSPIRRTVLNANEQNEPIVLCEGECNSVIVFSQKSLNPITVEGAYKSQLENLRDLNGDGADDIGFWDIKPTSKSLYVFDAVMGGMLCEPIFINTQVHKNLKLIDVFKKTGPNKITVTHSAQDNGKWVLRSEVVVLD